MVSQYYLLKVEQMTDKVRALFWIVRAAVLIPEQYSFEWLNRYAQSLAPVNHNNNLEQYRSVINTFIRTPT